MCDPGGHDTKAETRCFKRRAKTVEFRTHAVCDSQEKKGGGSQRTTRSSGATSSLPGCPADMLRAEELWQRDGGAFIEEEGEEDLKV